MSLCVYLINYTCPTYLLSIFSVLLKQGEYNTGDPVPKLFEQKKDPLEDSGTFLPPILWRYTLDAALRSCLLRAARLASKKKQGLKIRYRGYTLVSPVGWRQSTIQDTKVLLWPSSSDVYATHIAPIPGGTVNGIKFRFANSIE